MWSPTWTIVCACTSKHLLEGMLEIEYNGRWEGCFGSMYGVSSSNCTDYGARLRVRLINTLGLIKVDSQTPRKNQGELLYQPYPDSPESKCRSPHGAVPLSPCCKPVGLLTLQRSFDFESRVAPIMGCWPKPDHFPNLLTSTMSELWCYYYTGPISMWKTWSATLEEKVPRELEHWLVMIWKSRRGARLDDWYHLYSQGCFNSHSGHIDV